MYIINSKVVIQTVIAKNSEKRSTFPKLFWSGSLHENIKMVWNIRHVHDEMKRYHLRWQTGLSSKFIFLPLPKL